MLIVFLFSVANGMFLVSLTNMPNSVVLVSKRTISIERSLPVSEASANFSG
jgi:hypothetical protein